MKFSLPTRCAPRWRWPRPARGGPGRLRGALALALLAAGLAAPGPAAQAPASAAQRTAALAALQQGHKRRAAQLLQRALKTDPGWADGWWKLGTLLYEGNQYPAAAVAFARLTHLIPKAGSPWVMLGLCDFEMRNFGLSMEHIQEGRALGLPPDNNLQAVALYHQVQDLLMMGNYVQAGFLLRSFAVKHAAYPGVILAAGLAALHQPLLTENLKAVVSPGRYRLIRQVGEAVYLAREHKLDAARQRLAALVQQYPRTPYLHATYADILRSAGLRPQAEAEMQRETEVNPGSVEAILQLSADKLEDNQKPAALALAQKAAARAPENYAAYYMIALIQFRSGNAQPALRAAEESQLLSPNNSQICYLLAQIDVRLRRFAAARRERQRFEQLRKISSTYMTEGVLPASVYTQSGGAGAGDRPPK